MDSIVLDKQGVTVASGGYTFLSSVNERNRYFSIPVQNEFIFGSCWAAGNVRTVTPLSISHGRSAQGFAGSIVFNISLLLGGETCRL
jgi:hypothetical protein